MGKKMTDEQAERFARGAVEASKKKEKTTLRRLVVIAIVWGIVGTGIIVGLIVAAIKLL